MHVLEHPKRVSLGFESEQFLRKRVPRCREVLHREITGEKTPLNLKSEG